MAAEKFINKQISCFNNGKSLIETISVLAKNEDMDSVKPFSKWSRVKLNICSYGNQPTVQAAFNFEPAELVVLLEQVKQHMAAVNLYNNFCVVEANASATQKKVTFMSQAMQKLFGPTLVEFFPAAAVEKIIAKHTPKELDEPKFVHAQTKIFGAEKDDNGKSPVSKVTISYNRIAKDGKPNGKPWFISLENGTGIAASTKTGGVQLQPNSFTSTAKAFMVLSNTEVLRLLSETVSFVEVCNTAFGVAHLREMNR